MAECGSALHVSILYMFASASAALTVSRRTSDRWTDADWSTGDVVALVVNVSARRAEYDIRTSEVNATAIATTNRFARLTVPIVIILLMIIGFADRRMIS